MDAGLILIPKYNFFIRLNYRETMNYFSQDFKQNVMEKLFKEERFKAFQKKREELENVMDISDDDEWQEQQKVAFYTFYKRYQPWRSYSLKAMKLI